MRTPIAAALLTLLLAGAPALAQSTDGGGPGGETGSVSIRGRIFLPNGQPVMEVMEVALKSEDPRRPIEPVFSDGKGWFQFQRLKNGARYTVVVKGDGKNFQTTEEEFIAARLMTINVYLKPIVTEEVTGSAAVSVRELQHEPPPRARRAYEAGVQAFQQNQIEQARARFQEAIAIDPKFVGAYNELAVVEMSQRRYPEAEGLLRKALEIDPNSPHAQSNLGIALNHQGRHADALAPLRRALQLRPRWVAPKVYLGVALVETDELDTAETLLQQGTTATGVEEALAYLYLGKLYALRGEREKAIAAWENYLRRDPDSMNAVNVREMLIRLRSIGSNRP